MIVVVTGIGDSGSNTASFVSQTGGTGPGDKPLVSEVDQLVCWCSQEKEIRTENKALYIVHARIRVKALCGPRRISVLPGRKDPDDLSQAL